MPLIKPEEFKATPEEWAELAPRGNPRKRKELTFFDTFEGLEVRVALVHAPDYNARKRIVINSSRDVYALLAPRLRDEPVESFLVLCLNVKNNVDAVHVVARGRTSSVEVVPQHVFQAPMLTNSQRVILAHNHPSADVTPSPDDLRITKRIVDAGELLGIAVLDHLVCGLEKYLSLHDNGLFPGRGDEVFYRRAASRGEK